MKHIIIKCIGLFITILFVVSNSAMSQSELVNNQSTLVLKDSIKLLVLNKGSRKITICEGSIIKVNENKFSGVLSILNDSIIKIETRSIELKDIDAITKKNTQKVFLLLLASFPIDAIGIVSIMDGRISGYLPHVLVGSFILGGTIAGVIV
ncbi:hypothetical protein N9I21_01285 [Crocinitomicaceae bacterium]|jgi:hypothetical protein|nr:hypothetical protein [Crocinitomicaceae bacterium]